MRVIHERSMHRTKVCDASVVKLHANVFTVRLQTCANLNDDVANYWTICMCVCVSCWCLCVCQSLLREFRALCIRFSFFLNWLLIVHIKTHRIYHVQLFSSRTIEINGSVYLRCIAYAVSHMRETLVIIIVNVISWNICVISKC